MQNETTSSHTLMLLTKSIINKLENGKVIVFDPKSRNALGDELKRELGKVVLTEEDLNQKVRGDVTSKSEAIGAQNLTETEAFQSQKRALKARLGENELHGLYFQEPIRSVAGRVRSFLFKTDIVEDVFESDEVIERAVLETIQGFDATKIS